MSISSAIAIGNKGRMVVYTLIEHIPTLILLIIMKNKEFSHIVRRSSTKTIGNKGHMAVYTH